MKICFLADVNSIHIRRWSKYFVDAGNEVDIISYSPGELENVKVHQIKRLNSSRKIFDMILFPIGILFNILQINFLMRKIRPDILHAHYVTDNGFNGALTSFHPLIVSAWGSDVLRDANESKILRYRVSYALKKADKITTTAEFMGSYLTDEFNLPERKIIRIPWGIDTDNFRCRDDENTKKLREHLKIHEDSPVVLSNRSMTPTYNINRIIEAIPHVIKINPEAVFVIIKGYGTSDYEKEMKLKAKELGVIDNIRFISKNINSQEMASYLNIADMFISITKTDQFASSIMEGMGCGVIPIVSNIDVYKQYLTDDINSLYVDPDDPVEIAEKINYCIEHPEIKEKFHRINRKIIEEEEDWNTNAQKMKNLYENLFKEKFK